MALGYRYTARPAGWEALLSSPTGPYGRWMARTGNQMVSQGKRNANVDTGLMRSRIEFSLTVESGRIVGRLTAKTRYARHVHDGTRFYRGNPFLRDAVRTVLG